MAAKTITASGQLKRNVAVAQVLRLSRIFPHNFPDQSGQTALVRAFERVATSDQHAVALADELERTLTFAPVPANIEEAAERLAERHRYDGDPSPYRQPGEFTGSLTDGMTPEDVARWEEMAAHGKTAASRTVAQGVLDHRRSTGG